MHCVRPVPEDETKYPGLQRACLWACQWVTSRRWRQTDKCRYGYDMLREGLWYAENKTRDILYWYFIFCFVTWMLHHDLRPRRVQSCAFDWHAVTHPHPLLVCGDFIPYSSLPYSPRSRPWPSLATTRIYKITVLAQFSHNSYIQNHGLGPV